MVSRDIIEDLLNDVHILYILYVCVLFLSLLLLHALTLFEHSQFGGECFSLLILFVSLETRWPNVEKKTILKKIIGWFIWKISHFYYGFVRVIDNYVYVPLYKELWRTQLLFFDCLS